MTNSGEVKRQIDQGLNKLDRALGELYAGEERAVVIATEVDQTRAALNGVLIYLQAFRDRVENQLYPPFNDVTQSYQEGAGLIVSAMEGADERDQRVATVRNLAPQLAERAKHPVDRINSKLNEVLPDVLADLVGVEKRLEDLSSEVYASGLFVGVTEREVHNPVMRNTQAYRNDL